MWTSKTKMNQITLSRQKINDLRYHLNLEYYVLYVLAIYYHTGEITYEKYKGQIKSLRKGDLIRTKNTYHCTLNDRWYNHEPAKIVFNEVLNDLDRSFTQLTADQLIETLMLYSGQNYNFAVNVLYHEYIGVMLNYWSSNAREYQEFISDYALNIDYITIKPELEQGGYCWHCEREYSNIDVEKTRKEGNRILLEFFHTLKKGNLDKIPRYEGGDYNSMFW